ncbi:MAG: hypothetical protein DRP47_12285, partial [Candidatus Zixiibacteriota bacterium]
VELYDALGNGLVGSYSIEDSEHIDYTVPVGDTYYYILIEYGDAGNAYDLWWDDASPSKGINPAIINYLLN